MTVEGAATTLFLRQEAAATAAALCLHGRDPGDVPVSELLARLSSCPDGKETSYYIYFFFFFFKRKTEKNKLKN